MSKYLVAGAAGFIAARVIELLLDQGHSVYGLDNLNNAYDVRMKTYRLAQNQKHPKFKFEKVNISDRAAIEMLDQKIGKIDGVINLAARAGVRASVENPWEFVDTNVTGTLNLLELCLRNKIPKFVLASTSSIYGQDAPLPTPETAESSFPLQPYAASKKGAEALSHSYHFLHGIDVSIFRYFTVYGPAGRPDMSMFRFIKWIYEDQPLHLYGDGEQSRGFTYLDDIALGTILGLKNVGFEIMNLGGHEVVTMNTLINKMEAMIGKKAQIKSHPFPKADMRANHADVSKAGNLLGWETQVSLDDGLRNMIAWYQNNHEWAKDIETG
ncbi:MAG: SDR family NAD(P)-dependent oxidoreductase [Chloroflexota bacterium]